MFDVPDAILAPSGATVDYLAIGNRFTADCKAIAVFNQSGSSIRVSFKDDLAYSQQTYVVLPAAGSYGNPMVFTDGLYPAYFNIWGTVAGQYIVLVKIKKKGGSSDVGK